MLPRLLHRVLYACALLGLASCSLLRPHFERPEISVAGVELRGGNLLRQDFVVKLHVENPNNRDLPVQGVHADLRIEGDPVASGASEQAFVVPSRGAADVDVTVTANLLLAAAKLGGKLNSGAGTIDYDIQGAARIDLPFMGDLAFHQGGSFSLNQLNLSH